MIQLQELSLCFGEKPVLDRFSLTLPERGILCLSGPSGCGKTTLLRVLCGLETPEAGAVLGVGQCAVVFQEDRLLPWLSLRRNITVPTGVSPQTAEHYLAAVGLLSEKNSFPDSLSGGMRRRVAIARALAAPSDVLLLDEPFQGLDPAIREALYPLIRDAAARKPVVLVTHHLEEAHSLGAQVVSLEGPPLRILDPAPGK